MKGCRYLLMLYLFPGKDLILDWSEQQSLIQGLPMTAMQQP